MNNLVKKMAPTLVILAVAGYCSWSDDAVGPPAKHKESSKPALAAALLTPAAAPAPERDPFSTALGNAQNEKTVQKQAPPPLPKPKRDPPINPRDELVKLTSGLVLKATFVLGDRRVALINDRFYAEGDALPCSKAVTLTVAQVTANKVVFRHAGQTTELRYVDRPAPPRDDGARPVHPKVLAVAP